jgi:hypothetical protein
VAKGNPCNRKAMIKEETLKQQKGSHNKRRNKNRDK